MRVSTITVACVLAVCGLAAPAPQQSVVRIGHDRDGPASSVSDELSSVEEDESSHDEVTSVEETDSDEPESETETETEKETENESETETEETEKVTSDGELGSESEDEPSRSTVFVDGSTKIVSESGTNEDSEISSSSRLYVSLALVGASVLLSAF
ncbi:hypothetical protein LPJ58_006737 [Coemansia sp. RSA 1591]|nr:hypothetical protein LPJ58_006737 [Coemansia sp. RSA 1591]KAJ2440058.1 hypothetical protein IWW46_004156 [Coemansia sp. RSA 2440]